MVLYVIQCKRIYSEEKGPIRTFGLRRGISTKQKQLINISHIYHCQNATKLNAHTISNHSSSKPTWETECGKIDLFGNIIFFLFPSLLQCLLSLALIFLILRVHLRRPSIPVEASSSSSTSTT